jgi:hypothetical protein
LLQFTKKHNNFILSDVEGENSRIVSAFVNLAFVFDISCGVIHKFGEEAAMQKYLTDSKEAYLRAGFNKQAKDLSVIYSERWSVDIINRFVNTQGFFRAWYGHQMQALKDVPFTPIGPPVPD